MWPVSTARRTVSGQYMNLPFRMSTSLLGFVSGYRFSGTAPRQQPTAPLGAEGDLDLPFDRRSDRLEIDTPHKKYLRKFGSAPHIRAPALCMCGNPCSSYFLLFGFLLGTCPPNSPI